MMDAKVGYRAIGLAAGLVLVALLVQQLITLLLAVVVTLIISLPLATVAEMAERRGLPRAIGAVGALLAGLCSLGALGYAIIPSFISQAKQFANDLPTTVARAERYLHGATGLTTKRLSSDLTGLVQGYTHHPQRLIAPLESVGLSVAALVTSLVVVLITALYIAIAPEPLLNGTLRLLPSSGRAHARFVLTRIRTAWLGWLRAMAIDMLLLGGLLYLGMRLVGLEFAVGFAVFSAVLTVIPNFGSIISAVPPVLLGLSHSPGKAALVLLVYVIVNQIEGNLILPLVMARTVDLHPAVVAIGVVVMGQLFGLVGIIVAIPLLSLTFILIEELWIQPQEAAARDVVGARGVETL
jgi:predicted PurR-regulated permease PerM